tara:strand:- start:561 stop:818 length:258 start_codon:yes stop_codon:yes gene_type:complete
MPESERLVELVWTLLGSSVVGLIGFVWKTSHRVSALEKRIDTLNEMTRRDINEVRKDIEVICSNVDKNRDWTTNRMMSIAKDMGS